MDRNNTYMTHIYSGACWKQFIHYSQFVLADKFARFDYGPATNIAKYNQTDAPSYPLNNIIDVPIALFSGSLD